MWRLNAPEAFKKNAFDAILIREETLKIAF